jgi:hypothetical protein
LSSLLAHDRQVTKNIRPTTDAEQNSDISCRPPAGGAAASGLPEDRAQQLSTLTEMMGFEPAAAAAALLEQRGNVQLTVAQLIGRSACAAKPWRRGRDSRTRLKETFQGARRTKEREAADVQASECGIWPVILSW